MVFILAASSLHHALETLSPEQKEQIKEKTYTIPGLSLNPNTKNPKKVVQNLLSKDLKDKKDIVIWHDVLNNSISKHDSNNFRALSVLDLIETLKTLKINSRQALCSGVLPTLPHPVHFRRIESFAN